MDEAEIKAGDIVDYHSLIGGPVTSEGHEVRAVQLVPNSFGEDVAWLRGWPGAVSMKALTRAKPPAPPLSEVVDACYTALKLASAAAPAGVIDAIGDKVLHLGLRVAALAELAAEVRRAHADKDSCDYNECDKDRCQWCYEFDKIVHGTMSRKGGTGK